MNCKIPTLTIAGLLSLCISAPHIARAQDAANEITQNTVIKLDTEGASLYSVLKTLFRQANADFTIVESLKTIPVTVHIRQPFRIALSTVLKSTGEPITYRMENGVYQIEPIRDEPPLSLGDDPQATEPLPPSKPVMRVLRARNISNLDIVTMLGGTFIPWTAGFVPPYIGFNPFTGGGMVGLGGGGMNGMGGMGGGFGGPNGAGGGGAAAGLGGNLTGFYALPGLGLGFFGNSPNGNGSDNNGGSGGQ
jgi:hypothetical protein